METLQRTANRGSVSTGYDVANSCKFEKDNSERLQRSNSDIGTPTNADKFTFSIWIKRTELQDSGEDIFFCGNAGAVSTIFGFQNDVLKFRTNSGDTEIKTNRVFRDTAAWYHIVVAYDSTDSTEADRVRFYVNGVEETSLGTANYPSLNADSEMYETNMSHFVGSPDGSQTAPGYYTELYFLDGQVKQATDFGEFDSDSGIWIPKAYDGSFGNEGYYLDFEDASNLGLDVSGNSNNFGVLSGISSADQATDTCTNNFATLNPLFKYPSSQVINEGATKVDRTSGSGLNKTFYSTFAMTAGKFYFEAQPTEGSGTMIGVESITTASNTDADSVFVGQQSTGVGYYASNGQKFTSGSGSSYGNTYGNSDIIGVALDMDNRKVYFAKNNTYQNSGDPTSGSTGTGAIDLPDTSDGYVFAVSYDSGGQWVVNFGGYTTMSISSSASDGNSIGTFEFAPPSGYLALCTKNLGSDGG
jgi:hypothetical protein